MENSFYQKYLKYKKKYIDLKNNLYDGGAAADTNLGLYIPCEITNYTKSLYAKDDVYNQLPKTFRTKVINLYKPFKCNEPLYLQDPYILLKEKKVRIIS